MTTAITPSPPSETASIDVARLYQRFGRRLEQVVGYEVTAPEATIEDACQVAWIRLVHRAHRVEADAAFSWLLHTATHEALKLVRRRRREVSRREVSLDELLDRAGELPLGLESPGPDAQFEHRARIAALGALAPRQRRIVWLQAAGLSYGEIAAATGDSPRTVERQLLRARRRLRAFAV
jgi:RNA polymerase sigma factor (sigma-70 family)